MHSLVLGERCAGPCLRSRRGAEPASSSGAALSLALPRRAARGHRWQAQQHATQQLTSNRGPMPEGMLLGLTAVVQQGGDGQVQQLPQEEAWEPRPPSSDAADMVETACAVLHRYCVAEGNLKRALLAEALEAARNLKDVVTHAVNSKSPGLRGLQASVSSSKAVGALIQIARAGEPLGYEALQILSYRNTVACQIIVDHGVVDKIAIDMPAAPIRLQSTMCYLLTALAAFNQDSHARISAAGLIPQLVSICRQSCRLWVMDDDKDPAALKLLEHRASAVLRNLAHNTKQHSNLITAGAVDALLDIMRKRTECIGPTCEEEWSDEGTARASLDEQVVQEDTKSRINAALAVAILVGHEENNAKLQLDEELVISLLKTLEASVQGVLYHGSFWTVWKLCQGLANLTVNDRNKELITANGGIQYMAEVLFSKHHNNEAAHRYALSTLWNLAFNDKSRTSIVEQPGLVDAIRNILATTESSKTREVAKGALWTLGLEQDIKTLTDNTGHHLTHELDTALGGNGGHIMLSYEWGQQQSVLLIKSELQRAGYQTWMDVDRMSGSTLEAMAKAVEGSAVVLVCISKRYKESQACRTEAEYAFQQRKKIVPLIMESGYRPTGWLGALIGTRLYFDLSDAKSIPSKAPGLFKELGDAGRMLPSGSARPAFEAPVKIATKTPESWTMAEVEEWLKKTGSKDYVQAFKDHDMDGLALSGLLRMSRDARLINEVLVSEFDMQVLGHRLRFVEELNRLFV